MRLTIAPRGESRVARADDYDMIDELGKLTGMAVVMNTSFNSRERPIVCSPGDAVRTESSSGLDALSIEPFLLSTQ